MNIFTNKKRELLVYFTAGLIPIFILGCRSDQGDEQIKKTFTNNSEKIEQKADKDNKAEQDTSNKSDSKISNNNAIQESRSKTEAKTGKQNSSNSRELTRKQFENIPVYISPTGYDKQTVWNSAKYFATNPDNFQSSPDGFSGPEELVGYMTCDFREDNAATYYGTTVIYIVSKQLPKFVDTAVRGIAKQCNQTVRDEIANQISGWDNVTAENILLLQGK